MKSKTVFVCKQCGNETPRWQGQCPACGAWNSIVEFEDKKAPAAKAAGRAGIARAVPKKLKEVTGEQEIRFSTGMQELDRVLGGGGVRGSLILVGGAPGIGKSTLLLQICAYLGKTLRILYVSGEESEKQIKMRADRLQVASDELYILSETDLSEILSAVDEVQPDILIADSIQTLYSPENTSAPGSISQVKDCTMALMQLAKSSGVTVFVVGHVNKEGAIAGPKVLEHMVDCELFFEGEHASSYRILRAAKNRFGSTNEIGVFEMEGRGLLEVPNPSEMLLAGRPLNAPGTCVACVMEGTRPVLAEIQALVARTNFNVPRRTADGFDFNRANLMLAVLEKRGGVNLGMSDAYVNVIGGLQLDEPAADLALVLAAASSFRDKPIDPATAAIGEVGLTGEIRAVTGLQQRLSEASRTGFKTCIIPRHGTGNITAPDGMELLRVSISAKQFNWCCHKSKRRNRYGSACLTGCFTYCRAPQGRTAPLRDEQGPPRKRRRAQLAACTDGILYEGRISRARYGQGHQNVPDPRSRRVLHRRYPDVFEVRKRRKEGGYRAVRLGRVAPGPVQYGAGRAVYRNGRAADRRSEAL